MHSHFTTAFLISIAIHLTLLTVPLYITKRIEGPMEGVTFVDVIGEEGGETREGGRGKKEEGRGMREEGRGKKDEGRRTREEGRNGGVATFRLRDLARPEGRYSGKDEGLVIGEQKTGAGLGPGGLGYGVNGGAGRNPILAKIRAKIERMKEYPPSARRRGLEGRPVVLFEINSDGTLKYVRLTEKSGIETLDNAAVATVERAQPLPYYVGPVEVAIKFQME